MFFGKRRICREGDDDGPGGGGGGDADAAAKAAAKAAADAQAKAIADAVAKEVAGLKAKNTEVILKNKELTDRLAAFGDADPAKLAAMLKHFDNSEEARLMAEGKLDEVIAKRTAKRDADIAAQIAAKDAEVVKAKENASKFNVRVLHNDIRASAPPDLHPSALPDVLRHASEVFQLDEEGNVVPKDGALGKDGKTPYSPKEWFEDTRQTFPHRFANSNSGSSGFNGSGKGGSKTMARSKFDALQPEERRATLKAGVQVVDR